MSKDYLTQATYERISNGVSGNHIRMTVEGIPKLEQGYREDSSVQGNLLFDILQEIRMLNENISKPAIVLNPDQSQRIEKLEQALDYEHRQVGALRDLVRALTDERQGSVWIWQGDGEDRLESIACPILIQPPDLRGIVEADKAFLQEILDRVERGKAVGDMIRERLGIKEESDDSG